MDSHIKSPASLRYAAIAVATVAFQPTLARACAAPPERFDPRVDPYFASVVGIVTSDVATSGLVHADLDVRLVQRGRYPGRTLRLKWHHFDVRRYPGLCAQNGPNLKKGQTVLVYLVKDGPSWVRGPEVVANSGLFARRWQILPNVR